MNLPTWYSTGLVSVEGGSTTVTGTGSLWGEGGTDDNIMVGDLFCVPSQPLIPAVPIAAVTANGALELLWPWPGADAAGQPYIIRYVGIIERSTRANRMALERMGEGLMSSINALDGTDGDKLIGLTGPNTATAISAKLLLALNALDGTGGDKLPYLTGLGTASLTGLSAFMRSLLDDANEVTARSTLGANNAANLISGIIADARLPDRLTSGVIPSNNYNLALKNGWYNGAGDGGTSSPPGNARFGWLFVTGLGSLRVTQFAGYNKELYWRGSTDGGVTWSAWESLVPIYGSNANGGFVRFPGGFQVCMYAWMDTATAPTAYGNVWLGDSFIWTYPAAFSATPFAGGLFRASGSRKWITGGGDATNATQLSIQTVSGIGSGHAANSIGLYAFGMAV